ncbi:hypothetical protein GF325_07915 [Candidatus Bathyarchaeota archaeon]|nr:hypothetical protein [Candidatus Bathyarchaeota archaeon]
MRSMRRIEMEPEISPPAWLYNAWLMFRGRNCWDTRKKEFCYTMEQEFLMPLAFVAA